MSDGETYLDVSVEALAHQLNLREHDVEIVGARMIGDRVIRFYLAADHLTAGQVIAVMQKFENGRVILKELRPV